MNAPDFVAALSVLLAVVAPTPAALAPPQGDGDVVARFQIDGQTQALSRDAVALFLLKRTRNSDTTKQAIEHLIDVRLVEQAAAAAGAMPTTREVQDELARIETQVRRARQDFDKILATRRMTRATMTQQLTLSLAKQRLVAQVLGKQPGEVTPQHLELWSKQQRNRVKVVTDRAQLPAGVIAKVGDREVTGLDVGRVLFIKISQPNLERMVRRMIFWRCVAAAARREGITISKAELEQQYAKKQAAFERNPKSKGVPYEDWLVAMGGSKTEELASATARGMLQHEKLVRRRFSSTVLDDMLAKDGAAVMRRHGKRYNLSIIQVRATDNPNKIVRRDFAAAAKAAAELRRQVLNGKKSFAHIARTSSDDPDSKARGGKIGWQHRAYRDGSRHQRAPNEVLDAAFGLAIGEVSEPVRTEQGIYLVWVAGVEPEPTKDVVHERLLAELADDYTRELLTAAKIQMVGRSPRPGRGRGK